MLGHRRWGLSWAGARAERGLSSLVSLVSLVLLVLLALPGAQAHAQSRHVDAQRFVPALDQAGFLGVDGTRTPGPFRLAFSLFTDLSFDPVELRAAGAEVVPVERRLAAQLAVELGLGGRAALAARVPAVLQQAGTTLPGVSKLDAFALADPSLALRYRVLGASMAERDAPLDGPGIALQASSTLPIGNDDAFSGEGSARTELSLLADFQLLGAGIGGSLGWRHRFDRRVLLPYAPNTVSAVPPIAADFHDELTFGAALKMPLPPAPTLIAVIEARGATDFRSGATTNVELDLGLKLATGSFMFVLGGGIGLTDGVGTPDGRVLLGAYYTPPHSDTDGDGIPDDEDECIQLAEDLDGFEDHDGCPDPDNDGDLVPDVDDLCPHDAAEEGRDDDEDGCTDAAPATTQGP